MCSQSSFPRHGFQAEITGPPMGSNGLPRLQQMPGEVPEVGDVQVDVTIPCCSQAEEDGWGGRELGMSSPSPPRPAVTTGGLWVLLLPRLSSGKSGVSRNSAPAGPHSWDTRTEGQRAEGGEQEELALHLRPLQVLSYLAVPPRSSPKVTAVQGRPPGASGVQSGPGPASDYGPD